ncbi:MAG TPA: hypothetical protein VF705_09175, partial [Longimicrobium sp.]
FETEPTNGVTVAGASGVGMFTRANQPYYEYDDNPADENPANELGGDGILSSGETTLGKPWAFDLHGATEFTFTVYVTAEVPSAQTALIQLASISTGGGHVCGLTPQGQAYCWGSNFYGQLGDSTQTTRTVPAAVHQPQGVRFDRIYAGTGRTCALTAAGAAYCWGAYVFTPRPLEHPQGVAFSDMAMGVNHVCAVSTAGQAYCWGENAQAQLGDGSVTPSDTAVKVTQPAGVVFQKVGAGQYHSCALDGTGQAWCWGSNYNGQLGDSTTVQRRGATAVRQGSVQFGQLAVGYNHTCALTAVGQAYCWGENYYGNVGDSTQTDRHKPVAVKQTGLTFSRITAGSHHTCAVAGTGQAYCWGSNVYGELGNDGSDPEPAPVAVHQGGASYIQVSAGSPGAYTCAVATTGSGYCWGNNGDGVLGVGYQNGQQPVPVPVAGTRG